MKFIKKEDRIMKEVIKNMREILKGFIGQTTEPHIEVISDVVYVHYYPIKPLEFTWETDDEIHKET